MPRTLLLTLGFGSILTRPGTPSRNDRSLREAVKVGGWALAALWFSSRSSGWVKPPPRGERHYDHENFSGNFSGKERGDEWFWRAVE